MTYEGDLIAGRYRLESKLGGGAAGLVWRAHDERLKRVVAVKQLLHDHKTCATTPFLTLTRAIREARVAARLRHPHAVTVYDVVERDGTPYLVMEFVPARSLTELLVEDGPLAPETVARIGGQIASALAAAHANRILHRDVSPNNILITADLTAKIADFGLAHAAGEGTMTGGGLVLGTPAYLSPEVADGGEPGYPSDVFSLGAALYTALEGTPPFGTGENAIALLKRIAKGEINRPRNAGPPVDILMYMLRRDSAERPSMAEAEEMLTAAAEGRIAMRPKAAPGSPPPHPVSRTPSRWTPRQGVVAAAVLVLGALLGIAITDHPDTGKRLIPAAETLASPESLVFPEPTTSPEPRPETATTTTIAARSLPTGRAPRRSSCTAGYEVTNSWPGGFQATVSVRNDRDTPLNGWTVRWALPAGTRIGNLWSGALTQAGSTTTVASLDWNARVAAGSSTTFGLTAVTDAANRSQPILDCQTAP